MINNFYFSVALPGAGKTTWINEHFYNTLPIDMYVTYMRFKYTVPLIDELCTGQYIKEYVVDRDAAEAISANLTPAIVVSADDIKPYIDGYNPANPLPVHEKSVQYAREMVENIAKADKDELNVDVFMDGGGVNNHYTENIIRFIREHCPECKITCVYFDTPVEVCIERISKRERKVPPSSIYEKNQKIIPCIYRYMPLVDEFKTVHHYTNKYLLLDMDGTICGYTKARFDYEGNADFVNGELFLHLSPVNHIINWVKEHYDMANVYIVTAVANSIAWEEKNHWLDMYFPEIPKENRYFCGNKDYKYVFVKQLADRKGWKRNEMTLVDDYHPTIEKCMKLAINCVHPSNIESLVDEETQRNTNSRYIRDDEIIWLFKMHAPNTPATSENLIAFKYGYMLAVNEYFLSQGQPHKYDLLDFYRKYSALLWNNWLVDLGANAFHPSNL